jgi:predicted RNA-binding protein Jag
MTEHTQQQQREKMPMKSPFIQEGKLDREAATQEIRRYLDLLLRETQLEVRYDITVGKNSGSDSAEPQILIDFSGPDEALFVERQADLLLAIEHLALRWLHLEPEYFDLFRFDCSGFRALRLDELKLSARVAAQRVRETGDAFHFNPMPARDRRLIHLELTNAQGVHTASEGVGERRHLVIYPNAPAKRR